jgi:alpha-D-ribose 1-methylphosphonate 5-triphosphate synthase subunit PhnH
MIRETAYNEIFDAQRHFRTILDSMSRPGKLNRFAPIVLTPPAGLHRASAYVALALLNADVSYVVTAHVENAAEYLRANTHSRSAAPEQADFLFLKGDDAAGVAAIASAKAGIPAYPENGATVVIQVEHAGKSSATGGLQLTLEGPGVETREIVFVTGLRAELLAALKEKNAEFPLGVDAIFVTADECILCLPRTTRVTWTTL